MTTYHKASARDYTCWMNQEVWTTDCTKGFRRDVLYAIGDDCVRWMSLKGYTMDSRFQKQFCHWLYRIYIQEFARHAYGKSVHIPAIEHRNTQEDYDQFYHTVSYDAIHTYLDGWKTVEDFHYDSRIGTRVRAELQEFLYTQIDLDTSKQGKLIASFWDNNSDSDGENRGDIYINDANQGYHGGKGSKV